MVAGRRFLLIPLFALAFCCAGCRNNNSELLESELRARDFQYRETLDELGKATANNNALRQEVADLRQGSKLPPEQALQIYGLKKIVLGRGTSGYDNDGVPGDEALQVSLEPRDGDDHTIKVPGQAQIQVMEISPQGLKVPLCSWDINEEQMRQSWKQGFLSNGYQFNLPWKVAPQSENVRVLARIILPDGRIFETDKDIKIRLLPSAAHRLESTPEPPAAQPTDPFALPPVSQVRRPADVVPASGWEPAPIQIQLGVPAPSEFTSTPTYP